MYTCKVCGREYGTYRKLGGHSVSHVYQHVKLTELQRQVILGSLLGDMSIRKDSQNPRIDITHSINQTDYAMWKYSVLKNLVSTKPRIRFRTSAFNRETNNIHETIDFKTMSLPCLLPIYDLVRRSGGKYVSKSWLNEITDLVGLAVWYMDDGGFGDTRRNTYQITFYLGTMSFQECSTLQDWMIEKWDISSYINIRTSYEYPDSVNYMLRFSSKSNLRKFKELVEPHIVSSMRYKIDKVNC